MRKKSSSRTKRPERVMDGPKIRTRLHLENAEKIAQHQGEHAEPDEKVSDEISVCFINRCFLHKFSS